MKQRGFVLVATIAVLILGGCAGGTPEPADKAAETQGTGVQGLELSRPSEEKKEEPSGDEEGTAPAGDGAEQEDAEAAKSETPEPAEQPGSGDNESPAPDKNATTASLKEMELVGLTMDDIRSRLGEPKTTGKADGTTTWQYDFAEKGYQYPEKAVSVDVQGLTNGSMKEQLFVTFGDDKVVQSSSLYYVAEGEIMQYWVTKDGAIDEPAGKD